LIGDFAGFERVGHLAELTMPGGDAATREPWRMALSLLYATYGSDLPDIEFLNAIPAADKRLLMQMIEKGINSPLTSSCGRLFDAVAALAGLRHVQSYEGQAALELEMCLGGTTDLEPYPFPLNQQDHQIIIEPFAMTRKLVADLEQGRAASHISARFHLGLANAILQVCLTLREQHGLLPVALSGGVFQNAFLTENVNQLLKESAFEVLRHRQVPPNDGGLSLGQAVIAGYFLQTDNTKSSGC
jgi:hydrogenase maturation protein HypF